MRPTLLMNNSIIRGNVIINLPATLSNAKIEKPTDYLFVHIPFSNNNLLAYRDIYDCIVIMIYNSATIIHISNLYELSYKPYIKINTLIPVIKQYFGV